jgi:hypothetical protein
LETGAAALAFATAFLAGGRIYPMRAILRNQQSMLSFSAGIALAYVFVHVMPELSAARETVIRFSTVPTFFQGMAVYFSALLGFLVFFSLDQISKRRRLAALPGAPTPVFDLKLIGFAGYVCLTSYLLVNNLDNSALASAAYALAMAVHFLTFDHGFREEPGDTYARRGHLVLAAAAVFGWGLGLAFALPRAALAILLGFLSGGIIVNTAIVELPTGKDSRVWPFWAGALTYGALLINLR